MSPGRSFRGDAVAAAPRDILRRRRRPKSDVSEMISARPPVRDGRERHAAPLASRQRGPGRVLQIRVRSEYAALGQVAPEREFVFVRAVAGELALHELQRRHPQV